MTVLPQKSLYFLKLLPVVAVTFVELHSLQRLVVDDAVFVQLARDFAGVEATLVDEAVGVLDAEVDGDSPFATVLHVNRLTPRR